MMQQQTALHLSALLSVVISSHGAGILTMTLKGVLPCGMGVTSLTIQKMVINCVLKAPLPVQ